MPLIWLVAAIYMIYLVRGLMAALCIWFLEQSHGSDQSDNLPADNIVGAAAVLVGSIARGGGTPLIRARHARFAGITSIPAGRELRRTA